VVAAYPVLEHRAGRTGRWLRANRIKAALLLALVETVLVVVDVLQWRWVLLIAALVFAFHFFVGRRARYDWFRQLSWTVVVSQTLPVLVPVVAVVLGTLLVLALLAAAIVVVALVFFGRR
jgi:FtsH-binding integral membrane protein